MDTHTYNCLYCHEEYIPKRRHSQKYCSNSCRSKAYHIRNRSNKKPQPAIEQQEKTETKKQETLKEMFKSFAIVFGGSYLSDKIQALLTAPDDKPSTKGDVKIILDCILQVRQLYKIEDGPTGPNGEIAYFDIFSKRIVYKKPTGNIQPDNPFRLY